MPEVANEEGNPVPEDGASPLAAQKQSDELASSLAAPELALVQDAAARIVEHLARSRVSESRARFAIGDEVHHVRLSGKGAVHALARRLKLDQSGLQRIARVAERIRGEERNRLLGLTDPRGLPLSWSHFEELQRLRSATARLAMARRILAQSVTVRELREYLRGDGLQIRLSAAAHD